MEENTAEDASQGEKWGGGNPLPLKKQTLPAALGLGNGTSAQVGRSFWEPRGAQPVGPSPGCSSQLLRDAAGVVLARRKAGTRAGGVKVTRSDQDRNGKGRVSFG